MAKLNDQTTLVDPDILNRVKGWRDYVEAKLGFRNHWYPVLFSEEVKEGKPITAKLCGDSLLLNRIDGRVHCIRDRCIHRGVKFSVKPECHTKETITCWYHGFTYRFDTGKLCGVIAAPGSKVVDGVRGVRSYAVQEAKGLVFVFLGENDASVPPLSRDVPPKFLDEDIYVKGRRQEVAANWRHGIENGFDKTHIYIHRESRLIQENNLVVPLGFAPSGTPSHETVDGEGGPIGIVEVYGPNVVPAFEGRVEGRVVLSVPSDMTGKKLVPNSISMWIPCALKVDPWPDPTTVQLEWYVPIDEKRHLYFQILATQAATLQQKRDFDREYYTRWERYAFDDFNAPDIWARIAAEESYADDLHWVNEALFEADDNIILFRKLISMRNGGVQRPQHLVD